MAEIRSLRADEMGRQKELWKQCFGDSEDYIEEVQRRFIRPEQVLVIEEDGIIESMATVLDTTLHFGDGTRCETGYIFALATNPHTQGKGYARDILRYADSYFPKIGKDCLTLVPASPSLHRYFEHLGLSEFFGTRKLELTSAELRGLTPLSDATLSPITAAEYGEIRERQLQGTAHISYPEALIEMQGYASKLMEGGLYRVRLGDEEGCVSVEYVQRGRLLMKELLIAPARMQDAIQLIAESLPAARYHIRTPLSWEGLPGSYGQSFGMIKWFDEEKKKKLFGRQDIYLGLAFD